MNNYKPHEYTYHGMPSNIVDAAPKIVEIAHNYEQQTGQPLMAKAKISTKEGTDIALFYARDLKQFERLQKSEKLTLTLTASDLPEHEKITLETLVSAKMAALGIEQSEAKTNL